MSEKKETVVNDDNLKNLKVQAFELIRQMDLKRNEFQMLNENLQQINLKINQLEKKK